MKRNKPNTKQKQEEVVCGACQGRKVDHKGNPCLPCYGMGTVIK